MSTEDSLQDRLKKLADEKAEKAKVKSTDQLTDAIEQMSSQFKEMHESLDKLSPPGTPRPKAKDKLEETVEELSGQLKGMTDSVDKLAESEKQQQKDDKETKKKEERRTYEVSGRSASARASGVTGPHVELGKQTQKEILAALKNIRSQIVVSQKRAITATDVAAEHLASGGGLFGAAGAAANFKITKTTNALKRRFDPLNIINRLTGGSKLATVLAGKIMGRSEKSIRSAAGLSGGLQQEQEQFGSPSQFHQQESSSPSALSDTKSITLLEKMALSLTRIEAFQSENIELAKAQAANLEQMKDNTAEEKGAFHKRSPMQEGAKPAEKKEEGSWLGTIAKFLGPALLPIAAAIAPVLAAFVGLATAAYLIYKNFDKFKLSFSLLGDSVQELYQTIVETVKSIKEWVGNTITSGYDAAVDTGTSFVNSVKGVFGAAPTPEEQREELKKSAAAGNGHAQRKLAKDVAPSGESASILQQIAPKFADRLNGNDSSPESMASTAESLRKGEFTTSAIQGLKGEAPPSGSPSRMAATGALSQMVSEAYGKIYKDSEGNPLRPIKDNNGPRLEALTKDASNYLADAMSPRAIGAPVQVPGTPMSVPQMMGPRTELSMLPPQTGQTLTQANDMQRNFAMAPASSGSSTNATVINNVKNNNVSSTTIHQDMAPTRSEESSYLRSLDKRFAPA
jgi:hypothetical protein